MRGHLRSFHLHTADRRNNAWHCTSSLIIRTTASHFALTMHCNGLRINQRKKYWTTKCSKKCTSSLMIRTTASHICSNKNGLRIAQRKTYSTKKCSKKCLSDQPHNQDHSTYLLQVDWRPAFTFQYVERKVQHNDDSSGICIKGWLKKDTLFYLFFCCKALMMFARGCIWCVPARNVGLWRGHKGALGSSPEWRYVYQRIKRLDSICSERERESPQNIHRCPWPWQIWHAARIAMFEVLTLSDKGDKIRKMLKVAMSWVELL